MKYLKSYKLFESSNGSEGELLDQLSTDELETFYKKHFKSDNSLSTMIEMLSDLWSYVDDDSFVEDWIDGEVDHYQDEFKDYFDGKHQRTEIIDYIEKRFETLKDQERKDKVWKEWVEKSVEKHYEEDDDEYKETYEKYNEYDIRELLDEFDIYDFSDIIDDIGDKYDFVKDHLTDRFRNYSAEDICDEYYGKADHDFFTKNLFNIQNYLEIDKMRDAMNDFYLERDNMIDQLDNYVSDDVELQRTIWGKNEGKNAQELIENEIVDKELAEEYKFQLSYIEHVIPQIERENLEAVEGTDETPEPYLAELWDKLKTYFIDRKFDINEQIIEEYKLEPYVEGEAMGFFSMKE